MRQNKKSFNIKGNNNKVNLANGSVFDGSQIVIRGHSNTLIVGKGIYRVTIELIGDNNTITIGEGTIIYNSFIIASGGKNITIGKDCLFANPTDIRTTDHHGIFDLEGQRLNSDQDVYIGDRVWLARQVNVLRGSRIESDVVVGVGAVVTGTIPANSIAAGVPARVVRSGIIWRP